jgi:tRNA 2-selenouridine synthase
LLDPKNHKQEEWVGLLLEKYYDPLYDYQIKSKEDRSIYRSDVRGVTNYLSDLESEK